MTWKTQSLLRLWENPNLFVDVVRLLAIRHRDYYDIVTNQLNYDARQRNFITTLLSSHLQIYVLGLLKNAACFHILHALEL